MSWSTFLDRIAGEAALKRLRQLIEAGGFASVRGASGSSTVVVTAALARHMTRPLLLVTGHLDETDEAIDELGALDVTAAKFPALEMLPGESSVSPELFTDRLSLIRQLIEADRPAVIVAPIHALMQAVPPTPQLDRMMRVVKIGDRLDLGELAGWLDDAGYARVESIETPGEFSIRGGIIDLFTNAGAPVRIDLFGDQVEGIFEIHLDTMGSDRRLAQAQIVAATETFEAEEERSSLLDYVAEHLGRETVAILAEPLEIAEQGRSYLDRAVDARGLFTTADVLKQIAEQCHAVVEVNQYGAGSTSERRVELPVEPLPGFAENAAAAIEELAELSRRCETIVVCRNDAEMRRMSELKAQFAPGAQIEILTSYVHRGFIWNEGSEGSATADGGRPLAVVPSHELLHRYQLHRRLRRMASRSSVTFLDLKPGDFVVHRDHGIGRFVGLQDIASGKGSSAEEFLTLEFAGNTKLHVPAARIDLVDRYIGAFKGRPQLSHLGSKKWSRQTKQVSEALRSFAAEMIHIQAAREAKRGIRYPADTDWQREFDAEFPYPETDDQLAAIAKIKSDMCSDRPMDRLVCGDVGFGKTEVAIRAAFKAAEYGKQVAILVPTTVLAEQHERTIRERFADYPFRVESLSRFKTPKQQKELITAIRKGQVDIVVGTHRLLSADIKFADLGLVIIDEEQRFGVRHKQRLLAIRLTADVLTLTATPIPRTLHMALVGLRDISSLTTPPIDRRAIVTEVVDFEPQRIRRAIERELARDGQVFFVHNRIYNIHSIAQRIQQLVPEARVLVAHGQMPARQLESRMLAFMRREADILVSTTIIESGIDIPTANTMFISDADMFGLSELHQLRGRVGRYKHRAYCYLLLPRDRVVSNIALKRLRAIEQFSMLGAGFRIALRDLEIRGAGNLLGAEQSGHIAAVGYEMYCRLLERAVAQLKNEPGTESVDTTIDLGLAGGLPRGFIRSDTRRIDAYRRVSRAVTPAELDVVEQDLTSAYGELPPRALTLLKLTRLRVVAAALGIRSIRRHQRDIIFTLERPQELKERFAEARGTLRTVGQPDASGRVEIYYRPPEKYLADESILNVLLACLQAEPQPVGA